MRSAIPRESPNQRGDLKDRSRELTTEIPTLHGKNVFAKVSKKLVGYTGLRVIIVRPSNNCLGYY